MSAADGKAGNSTSEQILIFPVIFQVFLMLCPVISKNTVDSILAGRNRMYKPLRQATLLPVTLTRKHSLAHVVTKCITGGLIF
jgi:hypothetical protein